MFRGVLFLGGSGPSVDQILGLVRSDDLVCAADSGLDAALAAGIRPAGVVGDMDSISDIRLLDDLPQENVEIHPVAKDETDAELGLLWLRRRGCRQVVMIGGGEGRLDHTMALLRLFNRKIHPDFWYTSREEIRNIEGCVDLNGAPGDLISFYPVGNGPWAVNSSGLEWALDSVAWDGGGMSLSNSFSKRSVQIEMESGRLLSIRPLSSEAQ